ncbi:MAG: poly-beta-1,6-N-acetyl-D-glucosamine N-deacetylase PgaB, partial [Gammaproteobacteria bacterium]
SLLLCLSMSVLGKEHTVTVLSYHDVRDDVKMPLTSDALSINTTELVRQFSWLKEHGYKVVSLDDVRAAKAGHRPLPEKAILLTFDDGYQSFYSRVYPLLELFDYPAVLALVGKWMEGTPESTVQYGDNTVSRKEFLDWDQVKEMARSGLVEVASHSYDLHQGIMANPQNNQQPAAVTRRYDATSETYEADSEYRTRIIEDLTKSRDLIHRHTGIKPKTLVWPFGAYSKKIVRLANELGFDITLTLENGVNTLNDTNAMKRLLVANEANLADMVWDLHHPINKSPVRVAHVDLDYIYDKNIAQQKKNLDKLLDRIKDLGINTVYLQAYADADGDGNADALYFPNPHLPVRADLFSRVSWQLRTRAGVKVYAWLPLLAYKFPEEHALNKLNVQTGHKNKPDYQRLSPFHQKTKQIVTDIYQSLAKHASFDGLLFHDDAVLNDFEDASPWALKYYQREWDLPASISEIRESKKHFTKWSKNKTQLLVDWTNHLSEVVRDYRPTIKTARNIYARVVLEPESEEWFAQSFKVFLDNYDYTAIMAMPYMENASNDKHWLRRLIGRVSAIPGALDKTVFELQSVDWRNTTPVKSATLVEQMRLFQDNGAYSFGYYPDDFILDHPDINTIRPAISLSVYPYR